MIYKNPVIRGFYPDPSVCSYKDKYYLVCSSFQYFPGVPLFESPDLVNWNQIGYVFTRSSQVQLEKVPSSGGVFAATIRYYDGRFYVVTTNATTGENFYVYTDNIYGEWSDPVRVYQGGIDPSLYFENDRCFFLSNGEDDGGRHGITQCEIDVSTGKKLSPSRVIWKGSGGRFLEAPHMYKINGTYYLMAAEGGTEYGHMVTSARADDIWGEFISNPNNPVLTNRNTAPCIIQGIGHGDLIQDKYGEWHMLSLGFRQMDLWQPYHNLGREVFLTPVVFGEDGWFTAGDNGVAGENYEIKGEFSQSRQEIYTFQNTNWNKDWCFLRKPIMENYQLTSDSATLIGTNITLDDIGSPTFVAMRQKDFVMDFSCDVSVLEMGENGEAGLTVYMCENEHYDIYITKCNDLWNICLKLNIGGIKHIQSSTVIPSGSARLIIRSDHYKYLFYLEHDGYEMLLGHADAKYLSSEVSEGFTGVMTGLYNLNSRSTFLVLRICYNNTLASGK